MIFKPFYRFESGCAGYLFGCGGLGRAVAVDVREGDEEAYAEFAAAKGLAITHVIDTHVHADHRSGGRALAERVAVPYCLHGSANVAFQFRALEDAERIEAGNTVIQVLHTPGHTPESICLLVTDLRRGKEPWFLVTGDTLFVGSVGRPDLPGDSEMQAARLHESLHSKILLLDDDLEIYPAHFGGSACGAGLSGKPSSTLGFEKRWNPLLRVERGEFVRALIENVPERPAEMAATIAWNSGRAS